MRGLTLIETVLATALLSAVVLACVPLLRSARAELSAPPPDREPLEAFARAVDGLIAQRPIAEELARASGPVRLEWEIDGTMHTAEATRLVLVVPAEREPCSPHAWVSLRAEDLELVRWVRVPRTLLEADQ